MHVIAVCVALVALGMPRGWVLMAGRIALAVVLLAALPGFIDSTVDILDGA